MISAREELAQCEAGLIRAVEYAARLEALVCRFGDGRIVGVALQRLEGLDSSPLTRVSLLCAGDVVLMEQFSGNRVEVSCGQIRHLAEPVPAGWYRSTG